MSKKVMTDNPALVRLAESAPEDLLTDAYSAEDHRGYPWSWWRSRRDGARARTLIARVGKRE